MLLGRKVLSYAQLEAMMVPSDDEKREELLPLFGKAYRATRRSVFATEGASGGERWASLSERYRRRKMRKRPGRKILVYYGKMRAAVTRESNAEYFQEYAKPDFLFGVTGEQGKKVAWHQRGARFRPKRDAMQHSREQEASYGRVLKRYLKPRLQRVARLYAVQRGL